MKIDVERAEAQLLSGMTALLDEHRVDSLLADELEPGAR
jgi:hypothetical protein